MKIESFIPYHVPFEETLVGVVSSVLFKELELMNYSRTHLSKIIEKPQYGYTASASREPIGTKYVRITDIQAGKIDWNSVPYCRCAHPEKYLLGENDILFARTGGTTGKSFIVKGKIPRSVFASYLIRIKPKKGVTPDFLYWFFQTKQYWSQIKTEKIGSAQPNVNGKKLSSLEIFVPGIEVQEAIAKYLNAYRNKVYGKSVELPPIFEEMEEKIGKIERLLVSIEEAGRLRAGATKDLEELFFAKLDRVVNSAEGQQIELRRIVKIRSGKGLKSSDRDDNGKYGVYGSNGIVGFHSEYIVEHPTIVIGRKGSTGKLTVTDEPCWPIDTTYYVVPLVPLDMKYLYYVLLEKKLDELPTRSPKPGIRSTDIYTINVNFVNNIKDQRRIVANLDCLKENVDELKKLQDETEEEIKELISSILDRAFNAQL